jgi:hypothetical protein
MSDLGDFLIPKDRVLQKFQTVLKELNSIFSADSNKIIAQTSDEAAVMRGSVNGVRSKIR